MPVPCIIEPSELHGLMKKGAVKIIDATYSLTKTAETPFQSFQKKRIGDAVFFDIDEVADHSTDLPHMLPSPEVFAEAVSAMGISNKDLVVVYAQPGMVMGPARVWWTFRVFGHDNIRVLNGGMPAWVAEGYALTEGLPKKPAPAVFKAKFKPELVVDIAGVEEISKTGKSTIFDARSAARFAGTAPEPRPNMRSGHIPGSFSMPATDLVDAGGRIKPPKELQAMIYALPGADSAKPVVATCGSGVTACMIALVFAHAGQKEVAVYDGAWSEWGREGGATQVSIL